MTFVLKEKATLLIAGLLALSTSLFSVPANASTLVDDDFLKTIFSIRFADLEKIVPYDAKLREKAMVKGIEFQHATVLAPWGDWLKNSKTQSMLARMVMTKVSLAGVPSISSSFLSWTMEKGSDSSIRLTKPVQLSFAFEITNGSCIPLGRFTLWPKSEFSIPFFQPSGSVPGETARLNAFEFQPTAERDTYIRGFVEMNGCLSTITISNESAIKPRK